MGWLKSSGKSSASGNSAAAGRSLKQGGRKTLARQSRPGMHHASTWLCAFVRLPHLPAHLRLLMVCAHMCRCLWHVKNLLWQPPYSNFHKTSVRLRKSRLALISKFVETWSVQDVPLGMYAPAFLSLNKKQAKSHDILKAKRLGSID